jgi:uncharacterized membrane protein
MGYVAATAAGAVIWVALWAIGMKALDALFILLAILLVTVVTKTLMRYRPGHRQG